MHVYREPIRIGIEAHRKLRLLSGLKYDSSHTLHGLRHAHALEQRIVDLDALVRHPRRNLSVVQVKVNSWRIIQRMRLVLHLVLQVNHNRGRIAGQPMPQPGNLWGRAWLHLGRGWKNNFSGFLFAGFDLNRWLGVRANGLFSVTDFHPNRPAQSDCDQHQRSNESHTS